MNAEEWKNQCRCKICDVQGRKDDMVSKTDGQSAYGKAWFCKSCENLSADVVDQAPRSKCQHCHKFMIRRDMFCVKSLNPEKDGCKLLAWCSDHIPERNNMPFKELAALKEGSAAYKDAQTSYVRAQLKRANLDL